jgi:hypothetical protein
MWCTVPCYHYCRHLLYRDPYIVTLNILRTWAEKCISIILLLQFIFLRFIYLWASARVNGKAVSGHDKGTQQHARRILLILRTSCIQLGLRRSTVTGIHALNCRLVVWSNRGARSFQHAYKIQNRISSRIYCTLLLNCPFSCSADYLEWQRNPNSTLARMTQWSMVLIVFLLALPSDPPKHHSHTLPLQVLFCAF